MNKDLSTEKLINASIHVFYPTLDEAKRESFRTGDTFDANEAQEVIAFIDSLEVDVAVELMPIVDVHIDLIRGKLNSYFGRSSFGRYNGYKLTTKTMKDREDKYLVIKVIDMLPDR